MMMLSSGGIRGDAQRCRDLGIRAYLTKPIEQSELLDAIKSVFEVKRETVLITRHNLRPPRLQTQLDILLAEDNLLNQKLAKTVLTKWGHQVDIANNGVEALEKSLRHKYDVILMDLQMPELGGIEATRLIREREAGQGRHTPIVAMTANARDEDRQRCLDGGMDDYVSKPLNTERLRAVLAGITCNPPDS